MSNDRSPDPLRKRLDNDVDAWLRAIVKVANGGFPWVECFEAVIGAKPDGWVDATWDYGSVLFLAVRCKAKDLLPLTAQGGAIQTIQLPGG